MVYVFRPEFVQFLAAEEDCLRGAKMLKNIWFLMVSRPGRWSEQQKRDWGIKLPPGSGAFSNKIYDFMKVLEGDRFQVSQQ
jgi:hypothetical protein